jgi:hypothetical protein
MASVVDYLRQQRVEKDKQLENLIRNTGTYSTNRELLQSLGQGTPEEQDKGFADKAKGLLTGTLNVLGIPGRLVQAGVLHAFGTETPEMRRLSWQDELPGLIKGTIDTSASNLPFLKTHKGDSTPARIGKMLGAFALDVATDPTSYVGAPSSLSRKGASEALFRTAVKPEFLESVLAKSVKGESLIADLIKDAPVARFAEAQRTLGLAADVNTPAEVLAKLGERTVAAQELANRLGEKLFSKGRTGLIKELETITGSRVAALSLFKSLPENVRGGVILTNLIGKPITRADGSYARLTSGALLPSLGKPIEALNTVRQRATLAGNFGTRMFSGQAGPVLADVKRAAAGLKTAGPSRLIDYMTVKDGLAQRRVDINALHGKAAGLAQSAVTSFKSFAGDDAKAWEETFKTHFFAPAVKFDETVASVAQREAFRSAGELRKGLNEMRAEASKLGFDVNVLGDPNQWSPLILTDEAFDKFKRTGKLSDGIAQYNPDKGRDSFVVAGENPDLAREIGFTDPNNPGVIYLHAKEANDRLEKQALAKGLDAEAAKTERIFIEDPIQAFAKYNQWLSGAAANKRFSDSLIATGTVLKDVGGIRKLLAEERSATLIAGLTNVSEAVKTAANDRIATAKKTMAERATENLADIKKRIVAERQRLTDAAGIADQDVSRLTQQLVDAEVRAADAAPRISQLQSQLKGYSDLMATTTQQLTGRQRAIRNAKARLATASGNEADKMSAEKVIKDMYDNAADLEEKSYYAELLADSWGEVNDASAIVRSEEDILRTATSELDQIKTTRKAGREQGAQDLEGQILGYQEAISKRNELRQQLSQARKERTVAKNAAKNVEQSIAIEQISDIDNLIQSVADAKTELSVFKAKNKGPIKNMTPEVRADYDALVAKVKTAEETVTNLLNAADTPFMGVAKEYKKILMDAAGKLSKEQFQNLMVLSNEIQIQKHIGLVQAGARDEETVMKAMGDIAAAWESIRSVLPRKTFSDLNKKQAALLLNSKAGKLKPLLLREGIEPSVLVSAFDDAGYSMLSKSIGKQKLYAASGVNQVMETVFRTKQDPSSWERFLNDYLDPILGAWKQGITIGRGPGYLLNNLAGGLYMNYLGNVNVKWFKKADDAVRMTRAATKRIQALNPNMGSMEVDALAHIEVVNELNKTRIRGWGLGDLYDAFIKRGGFDSTELGSLSQQLSRSGIQADVDARGLIIGTQPNRAPVNRADELFQGVINKAYTMKPQRVVNNMAQGSEIRLRFAAFIDGANKYDDLGAAMDQVHLLHFDYGDLSDAEQWVRRLVPFYTWTRRNVPVQLRSMMMQPGKIQRFLYANQEFQNAFAAEGDESWLNQFIPEYLDNQDGFVTKFKFLDNNVGAYLRLPFEDVNKMFDLQGVPVRWEEVVNMLGPYTIPLELATGRDLATGRPLDALGKDKIQVAGNIIPQFGTAQRALAAVGGASKQFGLDLPNIVWTQNQEDKGIATALQLLGGGSAGFGIASVSKKSINAEVYGRVQEQSAKINKLAAERGLDPRWMREQLGKGLTPQQVAMLIASGMGKVSTLPDYSKRSFQDRQKSIDVLRNL